MNGSSKRPGRQQITEVWANNLNEEFERIRDVVEKYQYIAMDTEFPGIVARPTGNVSEYNYQTVKCNVDLLKVIQLGVTFADSHGNLVTGDVEGTGATTTWQFNFKFDLERDMYAEDSIDFLKHSGIDFEKQEKEGIDLEEFGELIMSSGLVMNEEVKWISFHGCYDFGYLLKVLTCAPLPTSEAQFFDLLNDFFPALYDIKFLLRNIKNLNPNGVGSLQRVAEHFNVERVGPQHQAGSDSLVTCRTFFKLMETYFENQIDDNKYSGVIYGLGAAAPSKHSRSITEISESNELEDESFASDKLVQISSVTKNSTLKSHIDKHNPYLSNFRLPLSENGGTNEVDQNNYVMNNLEGNVFENGANNVNNANNITMVSGMISITSSSQPHKFLKSRQNDSRIDISESLKPLNLKGSSSSSRSYSLAVNEGQTQFSKTVSSKFKNSLYSSANSFLSPLRPIPSENMTSRGLIEQFGLKNGRIPSSYGSTTKNITKISSSIFNSIIASNPQHVNGTVSLGCRTYNQFGGDDFFEKNLIGKKGNSDLFTSRTGSVSSSIFSSNPLSSNGTGGSLSLCSTEATSSISTVSLFQLPSSGVSQSSFLSQTASSYQLLPS